MEKFWRIMNIYNFDHNNFKVSRKFLWVRCEGHEGVKKNDKKKLIYFNGVTVSGQKLSRHTLSFFLKSKGLF